jgi:hypothetical protein
MIEEFNTLVESLTSEYEKFEGGNKSAGTRARKILQDIKTKCQEMRVDIQTKKNAE